MRVATILVVLLALAGGAAFLLTRPSSHLPPGDGADGREAAQGALPPRLRGQPGPAAPEPLRTVSQTPPASVWRLSGRVLDPAGTPVAGAAVTAWLDPRGARTWLGRAKTGGDGTYALPLDALAATTRALRATSGLVLEATKDGHGPCEPAEIRPLPLDLSSGVALALDAVLAPGGRVIGTVHGLDDTPISGADVQAVTAKGESLGRTRSRADGAFVLGIEDTPEVEILAAAPEHGLARKGPLRPTPGASLDVGTLRLLPGPAIGGRVLFADKTPIPGVYVYAQWVQEALASASETPPGAAERQVGAEADDAGRFLLYPHRAGRYALGVRGGFATGAGVEARTGDRDVELVINAHLVVVRVLDEKGTALPGLTSYILGWRPDRREAFEAAVSGDGDVDLRTSADSSTVALGATHARGRTVMLVEPGSAWVFMFITEGLPPLERVVRIPEEGHETRIDIVVPSVTAVGDLDLEILDAYGERIGQFDLELTTRFGSSIAVRSSRDDAPLENLPAGPARLKVHAGPARHHLDRTCQILSPFFPDEVEVDVRTGETTSVALRPRIGGWIVLHPRLDGQPDEDALDGLRVEIRPAGRDDEWTYVGFFVYGEGEEMYGTSILAPNAPTRIGQLFEPGAHELRFRGEGFETLVVPVNIAPAEETPVHVRLKRQ